MADRFTIKADGEVICKTNLIYVAAMVGSTYAMGGKHVRIINNLYGRVGYNSSKDGAMDHAQLAGQLIDRQDKFAYDYRNKYTERRYEV